MAGAARRDRRDSLTNNRTALAKLNADIDVYLSFHKIFDNTAFARRVCELMKERNWDWQTFCKRTMLVRRIYERLEASEAKEWDLRTVLAIAVGLSLDEAGINELIKMSGHNITSHYCEERLVYAVLIKRLNGGSIEDWNCVLESRGFEPLGSKLYKTTA